MNKQYLYNAQMNLVQLYQVHDDLLHRPDLLWGTKVEMLLLQAHQIHLQLMVGSTLMEDIVLCPECMMRLESLQQILQSTMENVQNCMDRDEVSMEDLLNHVGLMVYYVDQLCEMVLSGTLQQ